MAETQPRSKRRVWLAVVTRVVVCTALIAAAITFFEVMVILRPEPKKSDRLDQPIRVAVLAADVSTVHRQYRAFGTARPLRASDLPARVAATVVERPEAVRAGAPVAAGDLIVQLDTADLVNRANATQRELEAIDAQLEQIEVERRSLKARLLVEQEDEKIASDELDRIKALAERNVTNPQELDRARRTVLAASLMRLATEQALDALDPRAAQLAATRQSLDATLDQIKLEIARCRITAPFAGILEAVDVDVAENVTVGQRVARIVDLSRVEVPVLLPSGARAGVSLNDPVQLRSTGDVDCRWQGRISRLSPVDDPATRSFAAYVVIEQDPAEATRLAPGAFVTAIVESRVPEQRMVLPRRAVRGDRVRLIEDGRATTRPVRQAYLLEADRPGTGLEDQQWVALEEPLPPGALVVVDAARVLPEGRPIQAVGTDGQVISDGSDGDGEAQPDPPAVAGPVRESDSPRPGNEGALP